MIDLIDRSEVLYKFAEILPEADSLDWYKQAKPEEVKDLVDEIAWREVRRLTNRWPNKIGGNSNKHIKF